MSLPCTFSPSNLSLAHHYRPGRVSQLSFNLTVLWSSTTEPAVREASLFFV